MKGGVHEATAVDRGAGGSPAAGLRRLDVVYRRVGLILAGVALTALILRGWRPLGHSASYWLMVWNHLLLTAFGFGIGYGVARTRGV